jgi:hypothetical protein
MYTYIATMRVIVWRTAQSTYIVNSAVARQRRLQRSQWPLLECSIKCITLVALPSVGTPFRFT